MCYNVTQPDMCTYGLYVYMAEFTKWGTKIDKNNPRFLTKIVKLKV